MMPNIELPFRKKSFWRFIAKQIFAFFFVFKQIPLESLSPLPCGLSEN